MPTYQPGEIVDITIKGVVLNDVHPDGTVTIVAEHSDGGPAHWGMPPQAAITRVAPAEWPPRPGDVWGNDKGMRYFALQHDEHSDDEGLPLADIGGEWIRANTLLASAPGLKLVHREAKHSDSEAEALQPGSDIPGMPGYVVGTCGHRVAAQEWRAGCRTCERCPGDAHDGGDRG